MSLKIEENNYTRQKIKSEYSVCDNCGSTEKLVIFPCEHNICENCLFKYLISTNFMDIGLSSIKIICPKCKEGKMEIYLDDYINLLNNLLNQKNPNLRRQDDKKSNNIFCATHKDKNIVKYCPECKSDLCEKCIKEIHERYNPNHRLININDKNIKNKKEILIENIKKNNYYLNDLQVSQKYFIQKLESDRITIQTQINKIIKDLNDFLDLTTFKINSFIKNMKKIFQIINLSYYNYHTSNLKDKKEIIITKKIIDINLIHKNIDLKELIPSIENIINNLQESLNYNYEFQFDGQDYKKSFILKPSEDIESEVVTKIVEIEAINKLVSSLINGKIYVYDLYSYDLTYTIDAHQNAIWAMIKLSNNNIVTASLDKHIKVFDLIGGNTKPIAVLRGHKGNIFCLGEIKPGIIASGSEDKTLKLWDLNTKRCINTIEDPNESKINSMCILNDSGTIITGGDDNLIKIWEIYSDYSPICLQGHECTIWSIISINNDNTKIASGSSDNTIKIWDLTKMCCLLTLEGHSNTISSLKLLNNDLLVSASWDETAKIWNLRTKNCVFTLEEHKDIVWDVIQLNSGDLATCSNDMNIIIWSKN